jgi:hypothetical protein
MSLLQLIDSFNRFFIQDVTADAVVRVRRIDNDPTFAQDVDGQLDESILRVDWIYFNQHISKISYLNQAETLDVNWVSFDVNS